MTEGRDDLLKPRVLAMLRMMRDIKPCSDGRAPLRSLQLDAENIENLTRRMRRMPWDGISTQIGVRYDQRLFKLEVDCSIVAAVDLREVRDDEWELLLEVFSSCAGASNS